MDNSIGLRRWECADRLVARTLECEVRISDDDDHEDGQQQSAVESVGEFWDDERATIDLSVQQQLVALASFAHSHRSVCSSGSGSTLTTQSATGRR